MDCTKYKHGPCGNEYLMYQRPHWFTFWQPPQSHHHAQWWDKINQQEVSTQGWSVKMSNLPWNKEAEISSHCISPNPRRKRSGSAGRASQLPRRALPRLFTDLIWSPACRRTKSSPFHCWRLPSAPSSASGHPCSTWHETKGNPFWKTQRPL